MKFYTQYDTIDIVRKGDIMGVFIYAFTATGKSSVARKYKNVIDMESTLYKYLGNYKEDELSKGTPRPINKQWPQNYFRH